MSIFWYQAPPVRVLAAALCVAGLGACASAPPMDSSEIVARVGEPEDQVRYPAIVLVEVHGSEADVFSAALEQAMRDHGVAAADAGEEAHRLTVEVTRLDEKISATEVRVEIDATFVLSRPGAAAAERTVYRELAIRTIPGGRQANEIALNNAARAATQIAAAVASAGVAVPSFVAPHIRVPAEYRALRMAKQDAVAGLITQFFNTIAQR